MAVLHKKEKLRPLTTPLGMAVSWNVCHSGSEQPRVPTGPLTAAVQSQARADIGKTGLPLRDRKGHRKGGSWPRRGWFLPRKASRKGSRKGGSYQEGVQEGCTKGLGRGSEGGSYPKKVDSLGPTPGS